MNDVLSCWKLNRDHYGLSLVHKDLVLFHSILKNDFPHMTNAWYSNLKLSVLSLLQLNKHLTVEQFVSITNLYASWLLMSWFVCELSRYQSYMTLMTAITLMLGIWCGGPSRGKIIDLSKWLTLHVMSGEWCMCREKHAQSDQAEVAVEGRSCARFQHDFSICAVELW